MQKDWEILSYRNEDVQSLRKKDNDVPFIVLLLATTFLSMLAITWLVGFFYHDADLGAGLATQASIYIIIMICIMCRINPFNRYEETSPTT